MVTWSSGRTTRKRYPRKREKEEPGRHLTVDKRKGERRAAPQKKLEVDAEVPTGLAGPNGGQCRTACEPLPALAPTPLAAPTSPRHFPAGFRPVRLRCLPSTLGASETHTLPRAGGLSHQEKVCFFQKGQTAGAALG